MKVGTIEQIVKSAEKVCKFCGESDGNLGLYIRNDGTTIITYYYHIDCKPKENEQK